MFARSRARRTDRRSWRGVALLGVLAVAVVASFLLTIRRDTALRVVGREWERVVEIEEYTGERWLVTREVRAAGSDANEPLGWPEVTLERTGVCDGCQREGRRRATFTVRLLDPTTGRGHACELDEERWRAFTLDSRWTPQFDPQTGLPRCDSLTPTD